MSVINQAVILVGGLGSRLGHLTAETPKPLLEVAGRPFLMRLLDELRRYHIENFLLLAGFMGGKVDSIIAGQQNVRVLIEPQPLGTGGALRFARGQLCDKFFLLNGDSFFDINFWDLALASKSGYALALRPVDDIARFGAADFQNDLVTAFTARAARPGPGLINGGVSVLSREIIDLIPAGRAVSIESEIYPVLARTGKLGGRVYNRPFIDIGVPADFERAQTWIPQTLTRGAVVVRLCDLVSELSPDRLEWKKGAHASVKALNDVGVLAIVEEWSTHASDKMKGPDTFDLRMRMRSELVIEGAHIDAFLPPLTEPSPKGLILEIDNVDNRIAIDPRRLVIFSDQSMIVFTGSEDGNYVLRHKDGIFADVDTALSYIR